MFLETHLELEINKQEMLENKAWRGAEAEEEVEQSQ